MSKKKVLFIVSSGEIGGAQEFVKNQIHILYSNDFECYLITNKKKWLYDNVVQYLSGSLLDDGVQYFSVFQVYKIVKFVKNNEINLIIGNSAFGGVYSRLAALFSRIPVVYVSHGWSSVYNGGHFSFIFNRIEFLLAFISNKILCVSHNDFKIANEIIGIKKSKLIVISNSIFPRISASPSFDKSKVKMVAVSRLVHPKRLDLLVEAVKFIPNIHLSIIGDGLLRSEIHNKIVSEKIDNVTLVGEIPSFAGYSNFDLFGLISESEGLPISAIEAMSSGLALMLSNVGGCPELISNNGILVDNSIESIISGINDCIINCEMYKNNSLLFFNSNFNIKSNQHLYFDLYNSLIFD
jgi:glycosyltransferase involved in cell wall biosynthesis